MRRDILYCEGPGDIVLSYTSWKLGQDFKSETSVTFSEQLFEFCAEEGLSLHAISYGPRAAIVVDADCTVENKPRLQIGLPKIGYALSLLIYAFRLLVLVLRIRPRFVLICPGVVGWLLAPLLGVTGAKIVPILHNALWPIGNRPKGSSQALKDLAHRVFWRHFVWQTLTVSAALEAQVRQVAKAGHTLPIITFQPSFPRSAFGNVPLPKRFEDRPFKVLYVGRIEENKGALDVVDIASRLLATSPNGFLFDICGDGAALACLRDRVRALGLDGWVRVHGQLDRPALLQRYAEAHVVLVPTRTTFTEGFAMVVAEAILCLRPVVSCAVVPATQTFAGAVMLAEPDDIGSYVNVLGQLSTDVRLYQALVAEAGRLRPEILDDRKSFLAGLRALHLQAVDRAGELGPFAKADAVVAADPESQYGKPVVEEPVSLQPISTAR